MVKFTFQQATGSSVISVQYGEIYLSASYRK